MDKNASLLDVKDLKVHFPQRGGLFRRVQSSVKAVDGVDLKIQPGQTVGLVGESGCGKSSLGRALLRLVEPTAGEVWFAGENIVDLDKRGMLEHRRDMQMIFQDPFASLSPRRTVAQIIREPLDVHSVGSSSERQKRVAELLETVGLHADVVHRYPHEFSGGQRQRIGIARSLALNPKFIVADEPVSALDVSVQSQVLNLISKLQREHGIAFLFISHDLAVIQHVSDTVAVMYLGKIVELASADELYRNPLHPYTRVLLSAIPVPDPQKKSKRIVLDGDLPSLADIGTGCPFHTRCPEVQSVCRQETPKKTDQGGVGEVHEVVCHLYR
jgi:oligopeptide transport system ATP-binding protein